MTELFFLGELSPSVYTPGWLCALAVGQNLEAVCCVSGWLSDSSHLHSQTHFYLYTKKSAVFTNYVYKRAVNSSNIFLIAINRTLFVQLTANNHTRIIKLYIHFILCRMFILVLSVD